MKTWFITGTSRGFGREWAEAALDRGDRVAATARDLGSLDQLVAEHGARVLPLQLDVTNRAACFAAVARAHEDFGSLDVVVNNAGYGHFGMVEELGEAEARRQLDTNLFGALWITQAALPIMRGQNHGHIVQVSSVGGVSSLPETGIYNASKWALEGLTQALAMEVADFGVHVTLVEPAGYATDWAGSSAAHSKKLPAYDSFRANPPIAPSAKRADAKETRSAILQLVDAEKPPLRLFLGAAPLSLMQREYAARLAEWQEWDHVSRAAG